MVPIRNSEVIVEKIERLLSDHKLRKEMSENARERATEFTIESYSDHLINALSNLSKELIQRAMFI